MSGAVGPSRKGFIEFLRRKALHQDILRIDIEVTLVKEPITSKSRFQHRKLTIGDRPLTTVDDATSYIKEWLREFESDELVSDRIRREGREHELRWPLPKRTTA